MQCEPRVLFRVIGTVFATVTAAVLIATWLAWSTVPVPNDWDQVRNLIANYESEGAVDKISALDPAGTNWRSHWMRARIYRYAGKMPEARLELAEAHKLHGDRETLEREQLFCLAMSGRVSECEGDMNRLLADPRGESGEIARAYAIGFYMVRNFEKANRLIDAWSKDEPANAEPWYLLGLAYRFSEQPQDAITTFQAGLERNPRHWRMRLALGEVFEERSRLEAARTEYEAVTKQVPHQGRPWLNLGMLQIRLGDSGSASQSLEGIKGSNALASDITLLEANFAATEMDWKTVEELSLKLHESQTHLLDAIVLLRRAYVAQGRTDDVSTIVEQLSEVNRNAAKLQSLTDQLAVRPHDTSVLIAIGDESRAAGIDAMGYPWYLAAVELDKGSKVGHLRLARHYRETGSIERAEEHERLAAECAE